MFGEPCFIFQILSVEYHSSRDYFDAILELMERKGYVMYTTVTHFTGFADDFIFVKKHIVSEFQE